MLGFFHPEDGCNIFVRNVIWLSTDYAASSISQKIELVLLVHPGCTMGIYIP
jgi:hypothetical protein